eukprot:TRINITY_DN2266_c0_g2_i1.p2 TRINITY_DN2266_c0_g2~~TRINITY_DN2266_c0_g2_i1.p2  ORF type:complete len:335 (+),score=125.65 TRINITY_DN2266_c0_g2_i1:64-1068(+)
MSATAFGPIEERNDDATLRCTNLTPEVDEELLWEFMMQAGPLRSVHVVMSKETDEPTGVAFVEYRLEEDADYATKVLNMVKLFGEPVKLFKCGEDGPAQHIDIGANIFVGGLDPAVDEGMLVETFSSFGTLSTQPRVIRDDAGASKGGALVYFDSFEAADKAIEAMNGQFLYNRKVRVHYAKKKDSDEHHGSESQRFLAGKMGEKSASDFLGPRATFVPNQYFSDGLGRPITGAGEDGSFLTPGAHHHGYAPPAAAAAAAAPPMPAAGYGGVPGMPAVPSGMPAAPQYSVPQGMPPPPPMHMGHAAMGGYPSYPPPPMGAPPGMPQHGQYPQQW